MTRTTPAYQDFLTAILSDRERFFTEVVEGHALGSKLRHATLTLVLLSGFYGAAGGAYSGSLQALSAAIKLPLLFVATLLICFPAFYVVQILAGSRLSLAQVLTLVLGALALTAILLAVFVPITALFLITGANYYFLQLLHVALVAIAGLLGMLALHEGLSVVCDKKGVYPRKALTIMRAWAVLFAFVGIQVAWNLRPFIAKRDEPFIVTRQYEGNFYAAIIYSVNRLFQGDDGSTSQSADVAAPQPPATLLEQLSDTTADPTAGRP